MSLPATTYPAGSTARDRVAALAALLAGPLFLATIGILTVVELGFMHGLGWRFTGDDDVPWPSGLALGKYGTVQIANFAVTGLLVLIFVLRFRHEFRRRRSARIATAFLASWALFVMASAFPTDRATAAGHTPDTWHGWVHVLAFVVVAVASVAAPVCVAVALRGNERWRGFTTLSAAVAIAVLVLFLLPLGDPAFLGVLVVLFGWFAALGVRLLGLEGTSESR